MPDLLLSLAWRGPLALIIAAAAAWGGLALWFRGPDTLAATLILVIGWSLLGLAVLASLCVPGHAAARLWALAVFALTFAGVFVWWSTITPRQDKNWAPDVARLLDARITGDIVTLDNVRNFAWHSSREDFTARWESRQYDLSQLTSVDLVVSYWMGPKIAHTLVSFGFADGRYLVFSVEVRRTRGQQFSPIADFFKESELVLVAADERDIVRTRSNVRGEQVYLYRVAMPAAERRSLFAAYVDEAQQLQRRPRFYNTLTSNCTTIVYDMVKRIVPGLPWDVRLILSGYLPDYIYDLGALDTRRPFAELHRLGYINDRALASDVNGHASEDFSQAIRRGVPDPQNPPGASHETGADTPHPDRP
ncbi:DUF4105 domain-containing protein [Salinisphaera sp. T31B1]|uniref:Lnb N-terminal periplasmic domain-containing protein n=1 Tax=Salinisphaera sp. T31B1 TaxID=727963 RepID=UPI00333E3C95